MSKKVSIYGVPKKESRDKTDKHRKGFHKTVKKNEMNDAAKRMVPF